MQTNLWAKLGSIKGGMEMEKPRPANSLETATDTARRPKQQYPLQELAANGYKHATTWKPKDTILVG